MDNKEAQQKYIYTIATMAITVIAASIMISALALTVKFIFWLF